ncbi:hypothetical protein Btru_018945 [Bulinus truncatus]|nr:hypothetical protein Btru_018945 [Bulinus truncatus]
MEEEKRRRRSLRNLRRSSTFILPSHAVLQSIESDEENLVTINAAYGSAWLGENTVQDILTCSKSNISPKTARKGYFSNLDVCQTDEAMLPAIELKNSDSDLLCLLKSPIKPLTEAQSCNRIDSMNINCNMPSISHDSATKREQDILDMKSPTFVSTIVSELNHTFGLSPATFSGISSDISLKQQIKNTTSQKMKVQKKGPSKCETVKFNFQRKLKKSSCASSTSPNFLKTTQSFALKQTPKKISSALHSAKTPNFANVTLPTRLNDSSESVIGSGLKKSVGPKIQYSTSRLCPQIPIGSSKECDKRKYRKRLSLRKSLTTDTDLHLNGCIKFDSRSEDTLAGSQLISGYVESQSSDNISKMKNCLVENAILDYDSLIIREENDQQTTKSRSTDIEMTDELLKSFDLPFFPSSQDIIEDEDSFKKDKDKRKSLRRSSRYFSAYEMPLSRPSLEEDTDGEVSTRTSAANESLPSEGGSDFASTSVEREELNVQSASFQNMTSDFSDQLMTCKYLSPTKPMQVNSDVSPISINSHVNNEENMANKKDCFRGYLTGPDVSSELNTMLIEGIVEDFEKMCVVNANISEGMALGSELVSVDLNEINSNGNSVTVEQSVLNYPSLNEDHIEMMEFISETSNNQNIVIRVELQETASLGNISDLDIEGDSKIVKRTLRSRKSWDFSQETKLQETKTARKRNSEGTVSTGSGSKKKMAENLIGQIHDAGQNMISPGLKDLYLNKNYVLPKSKTWETIKESPLDDRSIFSKQKSKRYLLFESGITAAKLQRRHKKAEELKKKSGIQNMAVSDEEFRQNKTLTLFFLPFHNIRVYY